MKLVILERCKRNEIKRSWYNVRFSFQETVDLERLGRNNPNMEFELEEDRENANKELKLKTPFGCIMIWKDGCQLPQMKDSDHVIDDIKNLHKYMEAIISSGEKRSFMQWLREMLDDNERYLRGSK